MDFPRYRDWAPTSFDQEGLGIHSNMEHVADWLVCPCMQNRDSEPLEKTNYSACVKTLEERKIEFEEHSFNHWGPGWFEIILVEPTDEGKGFIEETVRCLENYSVLDEEAFSEMEWEEAWKWWEYAAGSDAIDQPEQEPDKGAWASSFNQAFKDAFENHSMHSNDYPGEQGIIEALARNNILEDDLYAEEICGCGHPTLHREKPKGYPWLVTRWCPSCQKQFYMEPVEASEERA